MHTEAIQNQIRERAFAIWEAEGCPEGTDMAIWLRAEAEVLETAATVRKPAAKKAPAKKAAPKTTAAKTTAAKTTAAKKAPATKPAAKKPAAKKTVAPKA